MNIYAILVASLVPLVFGCIWYNPKVFGSIWMQETGVTGNQSPKKMLLIIAASFIYAFLMSFVLQTIVIHQSGVHALVMGDAPVLPSYEAFMNDYGTAFRTFKHGVLHGAMVGVFFVLPLIGTISLYENKSYKYVLINVGYWVISLMLMGGIICAWV